jgi:hypothetical protein
LSPWMEMTSSSKCMESSLASARWLRWWRAAAARVGLHSTTRRQQQQWKETQTDLFTRMLLREWKTLRVSTSIYNLARGAAIDGWISIGG